MRRDLWLAGGLGLGLSIALYVGASVVSQRIPPLVQEFGFSAIIFVILFLVSLGEIPLMFIGLRAMVRGASTPRFLFIATFAIFVMFASVYASVFVLLSGNILPGIVLAALSVIRLASGLVVR